MLDYLVVGLGLAGISFCEKLERENRSFMVFDDASQQASLVASGIYNPVILKRFSLAWEAHKQLRYLFPFYQRLENKLGIKLNQPGNILRRFASVGEQNLWFEACDKAGLNQYLSGKIISNKNTNIHAPYGYGEVLHTGRIDTRLLIEAYITYLKDNANLIQERFNFKCLNITQDHISYKTYKARKIIFASGFGLTSNPYFNYLPLQGTKGELLIIKAPELKETSIIKGSIFLIPLGQDLYKIGATYSHHDFSNQGTEKGAEELLRKLQTFVKCRYEVMSPLAGIRPTVLDRRPLIGQHPKYQNLFVFNGLGSRGVMIAPYASEQLFNLIEEQKPLPSDMDIERFRSKYSRV